MILPGAASYQVVFTLPSELYESALANRHGMADLPVDSRWKSQSKRIEAEQDHDPAALSVLHIWDQQLRAHGHVHLLVPGEGPRLNGRQWKQATALPQANNSDGYYLVEPPRIRAVRNRP